jgi:hypothetical protein
MGVVIFKPNMKYITTQWKEVRTHTMMDPIQQAYLIIRKQ